jgi:MFS superfamily sulfate permease-like transporter
MQIWFAAVIDIDTSGIHALEDLNKSLQKRGIQVYRLKLKLTD